MVRQWLHEATLQGLAGERAFDRGVNYFEDERVIGLREDNGAITGQVRGSRDYRVRLWDDEDELGFTCNCPVGERDEFCKHCVAVGLAWLARCDGQTQNKLKSGSARSQYVASDDELREYLMTLDKSEVVDFLIEHAEWDAEFRQRLVLAMAETANGPDLAAFRAAIDKALRHRGFMDYDDVPTYARRIEGVVESLRSLLKRGHAQAARELVERLLRGVESALDEADDSDGHLGGLLGELQELHLEACRIGKPDARALAKFLFEWELDSRWEVFLGAAGRYAGVLGKSGLAEYRKLAEAKWSKVPVLAPGEEDSERFDGRWRITHIMETLAKQSGDAEALAAIKSRDLSSAYHFLEIAETYKAAGNSDTALEWAERGLRAFPAQTDPRLREFLAEEYHRRKRHDDAVAIAWTAFSERPRLDEYVALYKSARRAKCWPEWREKALAQLRQALGDAKKPPLKALWQLHVTDHSELVNIFLWEKNPEAAWAEAQAGGCCNELWFRLAEVRQQEHPEDAIAVYAAQLDRVLRIAEKYAYREVVEILRKIRAIQQRTGKQSDFAAFLQPIRAQHKARRNLMKLLDAEGW